SLDNKRLINGCSNRKRRAARRAEACRLAVCAGLAWTLLLYAPYDVRGCKPPHAQPAVVLPPGALAGLFFGRKEHEPRGRLDALRGSRAGERRVTRARRLRRRARCPLPHRLLRAGPPRSRRSSGRPRTREPASAAPRNVQR